MSVAESSFYQNAVWLAMRRFLPSPCTSQNPSCRREYQEHQLVPRGDSRRWGGGCSPSTTVTMFSCWTIQCRTLPSQILIVRVEHCLKPWIAKRGTNIGARYDPYIGKLTGVRTSPGSLGRQPPLERAPMAPGITRPHHDRYAPVTALSALKTASSQLWQSAAGHSRVPNNDCQEASQAE